MARNQALLKILTDVRGEARLSLNPAHNKADRDAQIGLIQREQERLWADHDWPHLIVRRYIPLEAGKRYYNPRIAFNEDLEQKADLSIERVLRVDVFDGGMWKDLYNGISDADLFAHDSMIGLGASPARRWRVGEDDTIEIWPVPERSAERDFLPDAARNFEGYIRLVGVRDLRPLVDDADRADLDDRLLILYSAAAILAESGAKDTNLKLEAAQRHYTRVKADMSKGESFSLFGVRRPQHYAPHSYISRYVRPE